MLTGPQTTAFLEDQAQMGLQARTRAFLADKRRQQLPPKGRSQRLNLLVGGFLELSSRDREGAVLVLERLSLIHISEPTRP